MSSLKRPGGNGRSYYRSLEQLADTVEFREWMHREFPAGASEMLEDDRRHFIKVMGASMALAGLGLAGCRRWPREEIVPYAVQPADRLPGVPVHYATSFEIAGVSAALLATSYEGRPIKMEGNDRHPASNGATDVWSQAMVLDLYDPDRSRQVLKDGEPSSREDFLAWAGPHFAAKAGSRGRGVAFLSGAVGSPSLARMREDVLRVHAEATWHEWEPLANDEQVRAAESAFGEARRPVLDLAEAKVVLALDADLFGTHRDAVRQMRGWAANRRPDPHAAAHHHDHGDDHAHESGLSRVYAVEPTLSLTGMNADERVAIRGGDVVACMAYVAARILGDDALRAFETSEAAAGALTAGVKAVLDHAIEDLEAHRGHGLVVVGDDQPAFAQWLGILVNDALGNAGTTVRWVRTPGVPKHLASLRDLAARIARGDVDTLVVMGTNPAFTAPADVDVAALFGQVEHVVHLGDHVDETGALAEWHVHRAHELESWGDGRSWDGVWTVRQPLIRPLWNGMSEIELLAALAGDPDLGGREIVRETFALATGNRDEKAWRAALHDGFAGGGFAADGRRPRRDGLGAAATEALDAWRASRSGWEVVFTGHPTLYDGRFANNGWLQELPDPATKLTWDTAVIVSAADAAELGVTDGDHVTVSVDGRSVEAPVIRVPGTANRTAVLQLGGGRRMAGRICEGAGTDFYPLRTSSAMARSGGAAVTKASGSTRLATTQDHHAIDVDQFAGKGVQQRLPQLFREADVNEWLKHPDFASHRTHVPHQISLFDEVNLDGATYAWGMSIDLGSCTGCNACVIACQAENNIPVVGKDQVLRGREMHWLRIDRYYRYAEDGEGGYDGDAVVGVALQPVACVHCENAPCEQVCPVAATVHDMDGLNVMVYNRCIGTRYCSNNCPYKVRRFNYFDYHRRGALREVGPLMVEPEYFVKPQAAPDELLQMQFNPEVSVRVRGVMEKCTYCTQRIAAAKITAKKRWRQQDETTKQALQNERIPVADGAITPACAQACPAGAIVFGDLNDGESRVRKLHDDDLAYEMLSELNLKTRTRYLARVRNPYGGGSEGDHHGGGHGGGHDHDHSSEDGGEATGSASVLTINGKAISS